MRERLRTLFQNIASLLQSVSLLVVVALLVTQFSTQGQRSAKASRERAAVAAQVTELTGTVNKLTDQVSDGRGQIDTLVGDNQTLREQLLKRGIKPAVPVRVVAAPAPATKPSVTTPTTKPPPSGSGPPAPPPTSCAVMPVCVMATCTPCVNVP